MAQKPRQSTELLILSLLAIVLIASIPARAFGQFEGIIATGVQMTTAAVGVSEGSLVADVLYTIVGKIFYGISYLLATIGGIFITLEAWLIGFLLSINQNIVDTPPVQAGFAVTLSLANLGFVFGIIIIAIATILRRESYGLKQTLWKLVVAAVLVNFSLVIAGTVLGFADSLSSYFLNCIDPGSGGCSAQASGLSSLNNFAKKLAGAFNPQRSFLGINDNGVDLTSIQNAQTAFGALGQDIGSMIKPLFGLVFTLVSMVVIVITLAGTGIMLLVRYVILSILMILMPLALLLWIFPQTSSNWGKWLSSFFRWTFFAPLVIFFLYLAIQTAGVMANNPSYNVAAFTQSASNPIWASVSNFFAGMLDQILPPALQLAVVVGLMIGGLFAANSASIAGGSIAYGWLKGAGGAVGGYMAKQGKKGGRFAYQRARIPFTQVTPERATQAMQRSRIPGVSLVGRGIATLVEKGGKQLVEADSREARSKDSDRLALELQGFMGNEKRLAFVKELQSRGDLKKVKNIGGKSLHEFLENEKLFEDYGQGKLRKDANLGLASNNEMRTLAQQLSENSDATATDTKGLLGAAGATVKALDLLNVYAREFAKTLEEKDVPKMGLNDVYSGEAFAGLDKGAMNYLMRGFNHGLAMIQPALVPKIIPKLKAEQLERFSTTYQKSVTDAGLPDERKKQLLEGLDKIMAKRIVGVYGEEVEGGTKTETPASSTEEKKPSKT